MELKSIDNAGNGAGEEDTFLKKAPVGAHRETEQSGIVQCCRSKHTQRCCIATSLIGVVFVVLGVVVLLLGRPMLEKKIMLSMALTPGSERTESWLKPPVQPHLTAYAFHITNPNAVLAGKKPILEERGPFVYKAVTIRDSDNNMQWDEENGLLTYRPRKIYSYVPELSAEGFKDPDKAFITVPNIPFWTGLKTAAGRSTGIDLLRNNGGITPFVNVSINGLLWGYPGSELPCLKLDLPAECAADEEPLFSNTGDDFDDFGDDFGSDFGGDSGKEAESEEASKTIEVSDFEVPEDSKWEPLVKPSAEYVNCKCEWGLFRDRNVTLRDPVTFLTGVLDLKKKGWVNLYKGKNTLEWWKPDSTCDQVKGQDAGTLYPGIEKTDTLEIFIDLMCRTIKLDFEFENEHAGIRTLRFVPPENALGSHDDPDPARRNEENECYCMQNEGFKCFKSGLLNMAPCKREKKPPLALSMPHFYQADPSYREAVVGLDPNKEKHQFYIDVVPEFGFPLAIRPRFQLNLILFREPAVPELSNLPEELIMPFMWAEDGFSEPSDVMAEKIRFGLNAPQKLPMLIAVACFVVGGGLLLGVLLYFIWRRRDSVGSKDFS